MNGIIKNFVVKYGTFFEGLIFSVKDKNMNVIKWHFTVVFYCLIIKWPAMQEGGTSLAIPTYLDSISADANATLR